MLDWQRHKILCGFIKITCVVLIISLLSYDFAWAGAAEVINPIRNISHQAENSPLTIDIPPELGTIKDSYISKNKPSQIIIYIQDAHANAEAQENEANLIKYLKDKYKINLVFVEGGFGNFDAAFFRSFPKDKEVRDKIAKYFLSKIFISGPEYLLITEENPPIVCGAEEKELYTKNLDTFRENQYRHDSLNISLNSLDKAIAILKEKYYSSEFKNLDSYMSGFREGSISLEEYISYLSAFSTSRKISLSKFPNFSLIIRLHELENKINFEKAESERQNLIDALTKKISKPQLKELVIKSLDFKANKITADKYYSYLKILSQQYGISAGNYNDLFSYIEYIKLSEDLDNSKIMEEVEILTGTIKNHLISNGAQRDIDSISAIVRILKGLSNINLSAKDYEYFKEKRELFNPTRFSKLLSRYTDSIPLNIITKDQIDSLERFYGIGSDRDKAIVSNSLIKLNQSYPSDSAIIVAGGFHTPGITSILRKKDVSYVVIAPNIGQEQVKESVYLSLLKDKRLPLENVLNDPDALQIISSVSDPQTRRLLITYWLVRASRYSSIRELEAQIDTLEFSLDDKQSVESALHEIKSFTQLGKYTEQEKSIDLTKSLPEQESADGGFIKKLENENGNPLKNKSGESDIELKAANLPQNLIPTLSKLIEQKFINKEELSTIIRENNNKTKDAALNDYLILDKVIKFTYGRWLDNLQLSGFALDDNSRDKIIRKILQDEEKYLGQNESGLLFDKGVPAIEILEPAGKHRIVPGLAYVLMMIIESRIGGLNGRSTFAEYLLRQGKNMLEQKKSGLDIVAMIDLQHQFWAAILKNQLQKYDKVRDEKTGRVLHKDPIY